MAGEPAMYTSGRFFRLTFILSSFRPPWDGPGIKKVVDDMMVHIYLNRLCPQIASRAELREESEKVEVSRPPATSLFVVWADT